MLYFLVNKFNRKLIQVLDGSNGPVGVTPVEESGGTERLCRWDFPTLETATEMAAQATALTGKLHIATDAGAYNSPRYDVQTAPVVGAEVSRYFNGDAYPAGKIKSISKTLFKITTDTGVTFYRVKQSGCWLNEGTWSMVSGHHSEQNPSF